MNTRISSNCTTRKSDRVQNYKSMKALLYVHYFRIILRRFILHTYFTLSWYLYIYNTVPLKKKKEKKNVYTKQQWSLWYLTASLLRHLWNVIMHQYHWTITIPSGWSSSWRNNEQPDRYFLETYPFQLTMPCNHSMEHHSNLNVSLIITWGSLCVHVSCLLMTIALITAVCCYPLNQPLKSNNVAE